jgi:hypothetical protein
MFLSALVITPRLVHGHELGQPNDAKLILDKALKALGGEEKISKFHALCVKGSFSHKGVEKFSFGATLGARDKVRLDIEPGEFNDDKRLIVVLNGKKCWAKNGEAASEEVAEGGAMEGTLFAADFLHALCLPDQLMTLKGKGYTLGTLVEQKVDGHEAIGFRVSHKHFQDVHLFFDKTSGLPIKSQGKLFAEAADGRKVECKFEISFSNYKETSGVLHFTHVRILFDRDDLDVELDLKEVKLREKVDPAMFEKP